MRFSSLLAGILVLGVHAIPKYTVDQVVPEAPESVEMSLVSALASLTGPAPPPAPARCEAYDSPAEMSCKSGGKWVRPYGNVLANEAGLNTCAEKCHSGGYEFFGLECPGKLGGESFPPAMVHCQCAKTLMGSKALADSKCDRKIVDKTHCVGPFTAGDYMLGSHGTGSVYRTACATEPPPPPPDVCKHYQHADEMPCKRGGQWVRPYGNVLATEDGVQSCAEQCAAGKYKYFGLECPGKLSGESFPPAHVHCQCANDLEGSTKLDVSQCDRKIVDKTHCVGPFTAGDYALGSHGTGSVYLTKCTPPPLPAKQLVKRLGEDGEEPGEKEENEKDSKEFDNEVAHAEGSGAGDDDCSGPFDADDAEVDPVSKVYKLGCSRRRIGAGFGRRRRTTPEAGAGSGKLFQSIYDEVYSAAAP